MRSAGTVLLLFALVVSAACTASTDESGGPTDPTTPSAGDPSLAAAASAAVDKFDIPAVGIARITLDTETRVGVAGAPSQADTTPLDVTARFHLGSDTKAMTAVLVAQLAESGDLEIDARIVDVLPEAPVHADRATLTIRQVLGHRSGLPDDLDLVALHRADDAVTARRDAVYAALAEPGESPSGYEYANVNYMLAGVIAEQVTGDPWPDLMQRRIFDPLGMTSCGFGAPDGEGDPRGHTPSGAPVPLDGPVTDNPPALGPAGTVHCALEDWGKFVNALLWVLTGTDTPILTTVTAADLFSGNENYVAGWLRSDRDGEVTYGHDGSNTLWYARAILRPERADALLLATNTGEPAGVEAIDDLTNTLLAE